MAEFVARGLRSRDEVRRTGDDADADVVLEGLQRMLDAARLRLAMAVAVLITPVAPESLLRRPAGNAWGKLVDVFQVQKLYIRLMTRSATLPPIRVAPATKARLEAVLREGESLTQFIEGAVCREAELRAEQNAAVARAKVALRSAAKAVGLLSAEDFLAGMTQRAHTAQQRICKATAAKSKRTAG